MYLHRDDRLAGKPRYFASANQDEKLMLAPPEIRQSVVFLASKTIATGKMKVGGTAFCVAIGMEPLGGFSGYLVTAKHCLDAIRHDSERTDDKRNDGSIYIRVNLPNGSAEFIETNPTDWRFHPLVDSAVAGDERVDVAIWDVPDGRNWSVRYLSLEENNFVNDKVIEGEKIGPGDEVMISGLFVKRFGETKNIPIVRIGNIAAMVEETVTTRWSSGRPMEAYLIEARSIGGLSGSPVFVKVGVPSHLIAESHRGHGKLYLLGLIHGHWDLRVPDVDTDSPEIDSDTNNINAGIAIVVPATKIYETLHTPELKAKRQQAIDQELKNRAAFAVED